MHAARAYLAHQKLRGLRIQLDPVGGGGSTTAKVACDRADKHPTLAIVDSDCSWPGQKPKRSSTAHKTVQALEKRLEQSHPAAAKYYVLPSRELENLLPHALLVASSPQDGNLAPVEHANRAGVLAGQAEVRFIDLKKGWMLRDALTSTKAQQLARTRSWGLREHPSTCRPGRIAYCLQLAGGSRP